MATVMDFLNSIERKAFTPQPYYSPEGDSLTFYFENKPSYRERIDDFLTVYRAIDGDGLVGCQVKGLPEALELLGEFGLCISDGRVKLTMIFIAMMARSEASESKEMFRELGRAARGRDLEVPEALAA